MLIVGIVSIVFFFSVASYLVTRNLKNRFSWILAIAVICIAMDVILTIISDTSISATLHKTALRIDWVFVILGQVMFFRLGEQIIQRSQIGYLWRRNLHAWFIMPIFLFALFIQLSGMNWLYRYDLISFTADDQGYWVVPLGWYIFPYMVACILNGWTTASLIWTPYRQAIDPELKSKLRLLLLSFVVVALAVTYYVIAHVLSAFLLNNSVSFFVIIQVPLLTFLIGTALLSVAVIQYKAFIDEGNAHPRDFYYHVASMYLLALLYYALYLITRHIDSLLHTDVAMPLIFSAVVILTHSAHNTFRDIVWASIKAKRLSIPSVQSSHLSYLLRYLSKPAMIENSPLLGLAAVAQKVKEGAESNLFALRSLLETTIDDFEPTKSEGIRSKTILKYEILRMMAYEGATEDQIMWDLGFEPDSDFWARCNPDKARTPRFPYTGKGDYAATSRASFKRLKAQAVEDLRWRLEEMERAAQD